MMQVHESGWRKWAPLVVLSLALTIIILDTTILNVSLRTIISDLHTNIQSIQWVITAYSLVLAAFTITGGRLGDIFGRKRMFMLGAIIFAIGSFITSISPSVGIMIVGEAIVEGIGAALMLPATSSLLVSAYHGRDRQLAFGVWGGIAAGAAAIGPVFGGFLTTYASWRWAFRINVFVVALLLIGALIIKEAHDTSEKPKIDFGGIVLSSIGLLLVVFGVIESSTYGWFMAAQPLVIASHVIAIPGSLSFVPFSIGLGLAFLAGFALWQFFRERGGFTPLVSLKLFKNRQFVIGASVTAVLSLAMSGLSFVIPVFLQGVKQLTAIQTGLAMLPMSLAILVMAPLSAFLVKYMSSKRIIQIGLLVDVLSLFVFIHVLAVSASAWALAPAFALFGVGMGLMMSQTNNMTLSAVPVSQAGEASGVNGTMRQLGATLGSAILGAVLLSSLSTNLVSGIQSSTVIPTAQKASISQAVVAQRSQVEFGQGFTAAANAPASITTEIKNISNQATVAASKTSFLYQAGFVLLGFIVALGLPNKRKEVSHQGQAVPAAAH